MEAVALVAIACEMWHLLHAIIFPKRTMEQRESIGIEDEVQNFNPTEQELHNFFNKLQMEKIISRVPLLSFFGVTLVNLTKIYRLQGRTIIAVHPKLLHQSAGENFRIEARKSLQSFAGNHLWVTFFY